jgi:hypothetical protein
LKIYKFNGTRLIIPREHIPFILLPLVEIEIAWARILLRDGKLIESGYPFTHYKPGTPMVVGVGSEPFFKTNLCPEFELRFDPYTKHIQIAPQYPF